jgi:hypothetical protein
VRIGRRDDTWTAQMALALPRFMRQLMAHKRMLHLILAGGRLAETLGGASFRLQLWHNDLRKSTSPTPLRYGKHRWEPGTRDLAFWREHQRGRLSFHPGVLLNR